MNHKFRKIFLRKRLAAALLTGIFGLPALHADTLTWNLAGGGAWSTSATNWISPSGATAWVQGSDAVLNGFAAFSTITLSGGITANSLTLNSTGGVQTASLTGSTIDVFSITTNGASIDMSSVVTGAHNLTVAGTGGRLNIKTAMTYTGSTILTGSAFMLVDGVGNNLLPTSTVVSLGSSATIRLARTAAASYQIAGLTGAGRLFSQANAGNQHTLQIATSAANGTQTFTGQLSNTSSVLSLTISGNGIQEFSGAGAKSYSGATTISGGTLILGSNLTNTSSVTVSGGALQSNVSSVNLGVGDLSLSSGSVSANGVGNVGTLVVAANRNFASTGGTLYVDLGAVPTISDKIAGSGTGTFSLMDTAISLNLLAGFDYSNSYTIFTGFSSGAVNNISITGYDAINYTASLTNAGVLSFTAVPEPSTVGLGALGAAVALFRLRRKRIVG